MKALESSLRWIVLGGVFALPFVCLIVATSLFFPYITGKNFAFRIIVEIITAAWLTLALVDVKYRPGRSWILGTFALFVFVIALADAFGAVPFKSFWSNFERMDGWITLGHLLLYVLVAVSMVNTENLWKRLWQTNLGVSVLVGLNGLFQLAGITAIGQGGNAGLSARVDATFGNPIYLAVYMLFNIFIAATLWVRAWQDARPGHRLGFSFAYGSIIVLDTLVLFFTGTRGTMLGLIGGALVAVVLYALLRGSRTTRTLALGSIVGLLIAAGALYAGRESAFVKNVGFLNRLATISASDNTIKARFLNMGIAWQGVKERPILGWGQENYALVFDKYYDPRMYAQEPWFDRVHNIIFDWWIAGGTLGLLAYLSIFGALLWGLWRSRAFSTAERAIFTGLLAGYFVHNLTVFDNVTSYILFGTFIAYIAWRASSERPLFGSVLPRSSLPFIALLAVLLLWGGAWYVNANAIAQNRALIRAISVVPGQFSQNLDHFKDAFSVRSVGTQEAREQLVNIAGQIARSSQADLQTKKAYYDLATTEMKLQEEASPLDARFPLFLGIMLDQFGDYAGAAEELAKARSLSEAKQATIFEQGLNAMLRNQPQRALEFFNEALELEPSNVQARMIYAAAAIEAGQFALANELLAPIEDAAELPDERVIAALVGKSRFQDIIRIWTKHLEVHPEDIQGHFTLAAAYYKMGNRLAAIEALRKAGELDAQAKQQVDSLIKEIQNGTLKIE